jgi:hypothetical protein
MFGTILIMFIALWAVLLGYFAYQASHPRPCPHSPLSKNYRSSCFEPMLGSSDRVDIHIYTGLDTTSGVGAGAGKQGQLGVPTFSIFNHSISDSIEQVRAAHPSH